MLYMRVPLAKRVLMIHLSCSGSCSFSSRSSSARSRVTPSPGCSGTRTNPFTGSIRSWTTSDFLLSEVLTKWKLAVLKADCMWAVMARVMLPPTFCSMKGMLAAANRPARRRAAPILWCPSM